MKRTIITVALSLAAFSAATAEEAPSMTCRRLNGAQCTPQQARKLQASVNEAARGSRAALAGVRTSVGSDGMVRCQQANGKGCSAEQLKLVREVSAALDFKLGPGGSSN